MAGSNTYDVIVIGGGHNGLVNSAYLARAGKKVLVLERRYVLGGAACTEEIVPGFKFSVCSYVVSLLRRKSFATSTFHVMVWKFFRWIAHSHRFRAAIIFGALMVTAGHI